jgi:hypothetical protein
VSRASRCGTFGLPVEARQHRRERLGEQLLERDPGSAAPAPRAAPRAAVERAEPSFAVEGEQAGAERAEETRCVDGYASTMSASRWAREQLVARRAVAAICSSACVCRSRDSKYEDASSTPTMPPARRGSAWRCRKCRRTG